MSFVLSDLWLLWILGPLYLIWAALWLRLHLHTRGHTRAALRYSSISALHGLKGRSHMLRRLVQSLRLVTMLLLVMAMTRPQTGRRRTQIHTEGVDIMLAIDTSGSMRALDLDTDRPISARRHRLDVVKEVVERFIQKREHDQIGMVVFGEQAFTQCPLTLDHGIVAAFLERLDIGSAGENGTAVGSGLATAVKRLRDSKAKSKVVILLTDGRNNSGAVSPKTSADIAKAQDVRVYTIGAGGRGPAPFLRDTLFGKQAVYEEVDIDEETLQHIAELTSGKYFRAEDTKALGEIYEQIDQMEKTEVQVDAYMEYEEKFSVLVFPALMLLVLETVLLGTRFRKIP